MKKILLFAVLSVFASAAWAQTEMVRLTRFEGKNITGINISRGFNVEIGQSEDTYAKVEIPKEYEQYLIFEIDGSGVVKIGFDGHRYEELKRKNRRIWKTWDALNDLLSATIYVKSLDFMRASSSTHIHASGQFSSDAAQIFMGGSAKISGLDLNAGRSVNFECSSSSRFEGTVMAPEITGKLSSSTSGNMRFEAQQLNITMSSSAKLDAAGTVDNLYVHTSSSASFNGSEVMSKAARLSASSSARIRVGETSELHAAASSSARITYRASGELRVRDITQSSSGSVSQE